MKIVKINPDHYIIVDDSEIIKEGDWIYSFDNELILQANKGSVDTISSKSFNGKGFVKITHSTHPMQGVFSIPITKVKELLGEVDVVELSKKTTKHQKFANGLHEEVVAQMFYRKGYNQALEDNKDKKYTEEDLSYLLNLLTYDDLAEDEKIESCTEYIKDLLQPKTEWEVEYDENGKLKLV